MGRAAVVTGEAMVAGLVAAARVVVREAVAMVAVKVGGVKVGAVMAVAMAAAARVVVREAVAMVAVEVGGVKAVETEVGAMVADWGEVAMAAGTAVAVMGVAMAARMVARADNGQWPSAPRLSGANCQRHTSSRSIASSGLNRSQRVA